MPSLGFGQSKQAKTIFVKKERAGLWHFWNGETEELETVPSPSLSGHISKVEKVTRVSKEYGESEKLLIHVAAHQNFVISSGIGTWFSKTFLEAANLLKDEDLQGLVTIEVSSSKKAGNAVFCAIYDRNDQPVRRKGEWEKDKKGKSIDPNDYEELFLALEARVEDAQEAQEAAITIPAGIAEEMQGEELEEIPFA